MSRSLSPSTRQSLQFLCDVLVDLSPFEAEVRARMGPQPLVWTDAMFSRGGVRLAEPEAGCDCAIGYVLWCPRTCRFFIAEADVSLELLELAFGERDVYTGQAELLAAAAMYWTCSEMLTNSYPAIHFVDNQGALGVLCRGSSSHAPMGYPWAFCRTRRQRARSRSVRACGTSMWPPRPTLPTSPPAATPASRPAASALASATASCTARSCSLPLPPPNRRPRPGARPTSGGAVSHRFCDRVFM